jgi:hypothetical protein
VIQENTDGSYTEGTKVEPNATFVSHAFLTVTTTAGGIGSSVASAAADGAKQAIVRAIGAVAVWYRLDGHPTTSVGVRIPAGQSVTLNMTDAANALFIAASSTAIAVTYTM